MVRPVLADHGDEPAVDEISMSDRFARPFKDLPHLQRDEFEVGPHQFTVVGRQHRQETIAGKVVECFRRRFDSDPVARASRLFGAMGPSWRCLIRWPVR
jgi:hypothetical protein